MMRHDFALAAVPRGPCVLLCMLAAMLAGPKLGAADAPFPLFYTEAKPFRAALAATEKTVPLSVRVTGITVPHHLLAADLIAEGFRLAAFGKYERIVILSPDHFKRSPRPCATTPRDFLTPLGRVKTDRDAVTSLLESPLVADSGLFSQEHGVQAVLPFAARFFPEVPVVSVVLGIRTTPQEWREIAEVLRPLLTPRTLVVQSTDFSHYLPQPVAMRHDARTLRALAAGDPAVIATLDQPAHLDSKAAQWLQMTLQREVYRAEGVVVQNRNAIHYGAKPDHPSTTSYITQVFSPDVVPGASLPGVRWCFAGDTHFGRFLVDKLRDPAQAERISRTVLDATGGAPLILNLEGVMLPELPPRAHPMQIGMEQALALEWLGKLKVKAVVLANNHTLDFGAPALAEMRRVLKERGIATLGNGELIELPEFRLAAATDVANRPAPAKALLREASLAAWEQAAPQPKPLFAFFHFGEEYVEKPTPRVRQVASWAGERGATLVLGCHPHRPSPGWEDTNGSLRFYSLGNFLFDQKDAKNSGGIVEVRFLDQGTWTARWIPLGNLYTGR